MRIFCFVGITGIFSALTMPLTVNFAISAINALTVPCLLGFAGFYQTKMNYRPAKYFVLAFTFLFISIIIWVLATLGKVPSNFFSRHAIIFGSAFQMIILSMGLADQFNLIQEESLRKEEELANRLQLEVDRQTQEIKKSLSDISGLLNGLRQAVFAINKEGLIIPPLSNFSQEIFKKSVEGLSIFDTLFKDLDRQSELYNKILFIIKMSIGFDVLQYDISEDLLPRKIIAKNESGDAQSLRISYSPIVDENDIIIKLMLVVEDVTEIESLEKEVLKSHEESALKVQRMQEIVSNNKRELRVFIREANLNLDFAQKSVQEIKLSEFFRATHTLKGNARIYNLSSLSNHIHMIEEDLVNLKDLDQKEIKEGLQKNYDNLYGITHIFIDLSKEIFGQDVDETVIVGDEDYLEIEKDVFFETLKDVKDDLKEKGLLGIIEKLKKIEFEDLKKSLLGLHKIVNNISFSLKKELLFEIKGDPVYLDKKETSIIKESLIHIIQNASDHGIQDKGKIEIKINNSEKHYDIMISDNGQGIDHQQIYQKALEKGLINLEETEDYKKEDSLKLIFLPGFSTKILATEFSGRGVGMDVVQTNILGLGGHIQIYSDLGKGTQFKIEIPKKVDS
jgi:two-component system chemotaxis sensor kinase CheA